MNMSMEKNEKTKGTPTFISLKLSSRSFCGLLAISFLQIIIFSGHLQIILSQEKNIQKLNELVQSLRRQLLQCRADMETRNSTVTPLTEQIIELERQQILED